MLGEELRPGLWRWTAFHCEWEQEVGCVALRRGRGAVLIDPLQTGTEKHWLRALPRPLDVLITVYWHARSASLLAESAGARVWVPNGGAAAVRRRAVVTDTFAAGDPLPAGVVAYPTVRRSEVVYWLPEPRALVTGDILIADESGLRICPASWMTHWSVTARAASLRPLLELPIELVLPSHGPPILTGGHEALAQALG